jgi:hypothetical protein
LRGEILLSNHKIKKVYKINFNYDDIQIRPFSDGGDSDAGAAASNMDEKAVYLRYVVGRNKWKCGKYQFAFTNIRNLKNHKKDYHSY